jgi:stress response protein YsnF
VSREPIDRHASAGEIGEQEVEVTLQTEEPVVEKATVAKEQVSVKKGTDTTKEKVSGEVQKERIEVDGEDVERVDK